MVGYKYSSKAGDNTAKAVGVNLPISTKVSVEICNMIRGMNVQSAKSMLNEVINQKRAVPYKRFNKNVGHRRGKIAAGRFPIKACTELVKLIESAETNAQFQGLNTGSLVLRHISAQRAAGAWHYGRWRRRQMKRTHIEIIVEESADKKEIKSQSKKAAKEENKDLTKSKPIKSEKPEENKEEKKKESKKDTSKESKEEKPKKESKNEAGKKEKKNVNTQKESQEAKK